MFAFAWSHYTEKDMFDTINNEVIMDQFQNMKPCRAWVRVNMSESSNSHFKDIWTRQNIYIC